MATCADGILKAITSDCTTAKSGGLEVVAYVLNRTKFTLTYSLTVANKITDITAIGLAKAYRYTGIKKNLDAGHDVVVSENRPNKYTHLVSLEQFETLADDILNADSIQDIIIVVEAKDKTTTGDGIFFAYGAQKGLFPSTDTKRFNTDNGVRKLEFTSLAGQEENHSGFVVLDTDYATTKALLESLV